MTLRTFKEPLVRANGNKIRFSHNAEVTLGWSRSFEMHNKMVNAVVTLHAAVRVEGELGDKFKTDENTTELCVCLQVVSL